MSERLPYFPFYVDDFLSDDAVDLMSPAELGGYIRLLALAWKRPEPGVLPNDPSRLAGWSRLGEQWEACAAGVLRAFDIREDGMLVQKRMVRTAAEQRARHEASVKAGKKGAKVRSRVAQATLQPPSSQASGSLQHGLLEQGSSNQSQSQSQSQSQKKAQTSPTETVETSGPAAPAAVAAPAAGQGVLFEESLEVKAAEHAKTEPEKPPPRSKAARSETPPDPDGLQVLAAFRAAWKAAHDGKSCPASAQNLGEASRLAKEHGVALACEFVAWFCEDPDPWLRDQGNPLHLLKTRETGYVANGKPNARASPRKGSQFFPPSDFADVDAETAASTEPPW